MKRSSISMIAIVIIFALIIAPAAARLSTSGLKFEAEAPRGERVSYNIIVSLSADEPAPKRIDVILLDWYQDPRGPNRGLEKNPDIAPYSAKEFLRVSPEKFTIKPGTSQKVEIEATMPRGDGGRYAIISVRLMPNATTDRQGVGIALGINTLVLLTISGSKIVESGEIENLSIEEPISSQMQNVTAVFKNTGNHHYRINATAFLKDNRGSVVATASPEIMGSVIPTARRIVEFSIIPESELKPGTYTVEAKVTLANGTVLAAKETNFKIKT
ncbi:MAG: hypothetical protein NTY37_11255 [Methanothrix sp.]|nr:hypothetical protein [Methanothrix sp.]